MRLSCRVIGEGPDILLLHGWGMNAAVWHPLINVLQGSYRLTVVELPGHGESGYDQEHSDFDQWVDAVVAVAPARATWLGWSLGGQIAQQVALRYPQHVHALVLVATTPRFVDGPEWPFAMSSNTLQQFAKALLRDPTQTLERFLSLQVKGDEKARETLRELRRDIAQRPPCNTLALEHGLDYLQTVDLRYQLGDMQQPILWLLGERDTLVPAAVGEALESLIPQADILIIDGAAHAPFLSHPRVATRLLTRFMESIHE